MGPAWLPPVTSGRLQQLVVAAGELAVTAGVLLLLFVAWLVFWTPRAGAERAGQAVAAIEQGWAATPAGAASSAADLAGAAATSAATAASAGAASSSADPAAAVLAGAAPAVEALAALPTPAPGQAFAVLRVPRFGRDWVMPVREGTGPDVLREGVGHYRGTALPGAVGNLGLAGHRTTWAQPFREIETLRPGDEVSVQTRAARFVYRVTGARIVGPHGRGELDPVPGRPGTVPLAAQLTLTTCHPEYSDRQRYVVRAVLVSAVIA